MYDATVFDKIKTLVPSGRGELEITDVNNAYIREGTMTFSYLDGWWTDAGTFDSLLRAANLVAQSAAQKPGSLPNWRNGFDGATVMPRRRCAAADLVRRPRTGDSRMSQGHRLRHRLARLAGSDRRRPGAAVLPLSRRPRLLPGSAAHRATAWPPRFRRETTQISAALSYPGHHQGVPLSPPSDTIAGRR